MLLEHLQSQAFQVGVGESPLYLCRYKLRINYWANVKGHKESPPVKSMLEECCEHGNNIKIFGWTGNREAQIVGIAECAVSPINIQRSILVTQLL